MPSLDRRCCGTFVSHRGVTRRVLAANPCKRLHALLHCIFICFIFETVERRPAPCHVLGGASSFRTVFFLLPLPIISFSLVTAQAVGSFETAALRSSRLFPLLFKWCHTFRSPCLAPCAPCSPHDYSLLCVGQCLVGIGRGGSQGD
ncbi:hypothetical protein TRVL_09846 [Trypanosoma vivax]|nr:hypothetical protein TRVL_09846 [Trypanosoma vivax]